jgi:hypothetical protein
MDRMLCYNTCIARAPNRIESFTRPFPSQIKSNQVECWRLQEETTHNKIIRTNNDRYSFLYIFIFLHFFSNRNTIPNDFFFLCFYQIMIYLVVTAIPILFPSRMRYDTISKQSVRCEGFFWYIRDDDDRICLFLFGFFSCITTSSSGIIISFCC